MSFLQTVDQFFALKVPMRLGEMNSLFRGIDNAFQVYAKHVADKIGIPWLYRRTCIFLLQGLWLSLFMSKLISYLEKVRQVSHRLGSMNDFCLIFLFFLLYKILDFGLPVSMKLRQLYDLFCWLIFQNPKYSTLCLHNNWSLLIYYTASKEDLIPPVPILTRHKKELGIKAFVKRELHDPRLPDVRTSTEITVLTTPTLCVQLNTLHVRSFLSSSTFFHSIFLLTLVRCFFCRTVIFFC